MLISILLALLYGVVILGVGLAVAHYGLRLREGISVCAVTAVFGTALYLVILNTLGYFIWIRLAFPLALLLVFMIAVGLLLYAWIKGAWRVSVALPPQWICWSYGICILLSGFMNARFVGSDPWTWLHFPLAATIAEGNFPVMVPIEPTRHLAYHYGPALLAAAFHKLTGFSLQAGFALQPLIGGAGILLFVGALVYAISRSYRTAFISSLLAFAGNGLMWLNVTPLLRDFIGVLTHTAAPVSPFRHLTDLFINPITTAPFTFFGHRSLATGLPLFFGLLFVLHALWNTRDRGSAWRLAMAVLIISLALTLTMEIGFVALLIVVPLFAVVTLLLRRFVAPLPLEYTLLSFVTLLVTFFIARVHGGVLTWTTQEGSSFAFHLNLHVPIHTSGYWVAPWNLLFLQNFGLPLLLFPFAALFFWRKRTHDIFPLLLIALALLHFLVPFVILYTKIQGEMHRLFYTATSLFALLVGWYVSEQFLESRLKAVRLSGYTVISAMLLSSLFTFGARIVAPNFRFQHESLFATMPAITEEQRALYAWVATHTGLHDYFYQRSMNVDWDTTDEVTAQQRDRILFMAYTGRYSLGPIGVWEPDQFWIQLVSRAEEQCSIEALRSMQVQYLVVENADRAAWFRAHCSPSVWELAYDGGGGKVPYPRVYRFHRI